MIYNKMYNISNRNIVWHNHLVQKKDREYLHKHHAMLLWFTGLSGSGKSSIASSLERELHVRLVSTYLLDGDNIRHGLCCDLGFSDFDRYENLRRVGEVASLMVDAGLVVLAAFISPYFLERQMIRNIFPLGSFFEIFVDTPLSMCERRDSKGLYKMARRGEIKNFIGVHKSYERPKRPEIYLDGRKSIKNLIDELLEVIISKIILQNI